MSLILRPSARFPAPPGPVVLAVMDGVGLAPPGPGNAVGLARTPTLDHLGREAQFASLRAHGLAVGLPSDEDMGNSEVGHNALGAGRVYAQGARRVREAIQNEELFQAPVWQDVMTRCREGCVLHLLGLLSDGNVHSHESHLHAMLQRAAADGAPRARVHILLDGRDVPPTSALSYVDRLELELARCREAGHDFRIASGGGRMTTTMDRYEADWEMVARGWRAHVHGEGRRFGSAREAIETFRAEEPGVIDQWLPSFVIAADDAPVGAMDDGDCVILFNFRGDRALEISRAFDEGESFDAFDRGRRPDVLFAGMTSYDSDLGIPRQFLVPPPVITGTISEALAATGIRQLACSETQKYGHITYFWNGNRSGAFDESLEDYVEVPSDTRPFDERPWMKSAEITDVVVDALRRGEHPFLRLNFPGGDMVGHTGDLEATILSMEAVDLALGRLLRAVTKVKGTLVVTADHGNAEQMFELDERGQVQRDEVGKPRVRISHSLNPVGLWILRTAGAKVQIDPARDGTGSERPGLANVAATLCELLGYEPPEDYEPSLLMAPR